MINDRHRPRNSQGSFFFIFSSHQNWSRIPEKRGTLRDAESISPAA